MKKILYTSVIPFACLSMCVILIMAIMGLALSINSEESGAKLACGYVTSQLGYPSTACASPDTGPLYLELNLLVAALVVVIFFFLCFAFYLRRKKLV